MTKTQNGLEKQTGNNDLFANYNNGDLVLSAQQVIITPKLAVKSRSWRIKRNLNLDCIVVLVAQD